MSLMCLLALILVLSIFGRNCPKDAAAGFVAYGIPVGEYVSFATWAFKCHLIVYLMQSDNCFIPVLIT